MFGRVLRDEATEGGSGGSGGEQPSEADQLRAQIDAAKQEAKAAADALLANVPERLKPMIPEGLEPVALIRWYTKAKATGAFDPVKVPKTDDRKPTVTPQSPDLSKLSPVARIASGYKK